MMVSDDLSVNAEAIGVAKKGAQGPFLAFNFVSKVHTKSVQQKVQKSFGAYLANKIKSIIKKVYCLTPYKYPNG